MIIKIAFFIFKLILLLICTGRRVKKNEPFFVFKCFASFISVLPITHPLNGICQKIGDVPFYLSLSLSLLRSIFNCCNSWTKRKLEFLNSLRKKTNLRFVHFRIKLSEKRVGQRILNLMIGIDKNHR